MEIARKVVAIDRWDLITYDDPTPNELAHHFIDNIGNSLADKREYTIVILGRSGPTGKTWLCNALKNHGFNAVEISEELILARVDFGTDNGNHYYINHAEKYIVIVLNKPWC